jgi:hypothetical protein
MPRIYWQSLALDGESKGGNHVERVILLEAAERPVPASLVHGSKTTTPHGHPARREPVGRVGEDNVDAPCRHEAHKLHAVCEVDDGTRLAVGFEVPQLHAVIVGRMGVRL